jgi:hypothetical protein
MPWLPIFVDEHDAKLLIYWLNQEEEIAVLVSAGRGKWKAVSSVTDLKDGEYSLWHIPSEPLPLWCGNSHQGIIVNPWDGWTEELSGSSLTTPNSGVNHPGVIRLTLNTRHQPYSKQELTKLTTPNGRLMRDTDILSFSDFQWIGNRYGGAARQTHQWWRRLKYWVSCQAVRLTPCGVRWSFWAFPSAFCQLKSGMEYSANGWDLSMAVREAQGKTT